MIEVRSSYETLGDRVVMLHTNDIKCEPIEALYNVEAWATGASATTRQLNKRVDILAHDGFLLAQSSGTERTGQALPLSCVFMRIYYSDNAWVSTMAIEYARFGKIHSAAARMAVYLLPCFNIVERDVVRGNTNDVAYIVVLTRLSVS